MSREQSSALRAAAQRRLAERRLRRFMADHGYPDPDTIRSERTIWHGASGQTHSSRVCSTPSAGTVIVTSPEIRQILAQAYTQALQLPQEWSPAQREAFLDDEASRISHEVAELSAEMGAQAVGEWTKAHGQDPDYLTNVGLLNTARTQAMEIVLHNEIYEQIPPEQEEPSSLWGEDLPIPDRSQVSWDQRWTHPDYRSEPSPQIETLIDELWPTPAFSALFRIKAGYLLAARAEDNLALPSGPHDPLGAELAQMIYTDLRSDGLPER
ncbi:hypothetical protein [Mycobacterium kansasii]|uniref:hypothetical protein n=1 Tax=Mycobacterium kansasii TaxID=1768 RepID=UPI0004D94FC4|nr:hypothetical protein [Mycobacterium kansasii]KEP41880.1 hypothetical protein MKSMC1_28780 [Mycobacterium kansasii]